MRFGLAAFATILLVGCTHTQKPADVVEAPPAKPAVVAAPAAAVAQNTCTADTECKDGFLCVRSQCVAITAELAECSMMRVHFEFNQAVLKAEDTKGLERMARCLRADHALHMMIEGNADERGTEEYNLALGSQRASSVERYLETLGASRAQLDTISYGYEKPLCTEHNETCWASNRRAAIKPEIKPEAKPEVKGKKK
jgi:peptidoglycan-associated lipoprotein